MHLTTVNWCSPLKVCVELLQCRCHSKHLVALKLCSLLLTASFQELAPVLQDREQEAAATVQRPFVEA